MAVYKVYVLSQGGASIIDHADTIEMGGSGYTDAASRDLAESYARTGVAQALREGYVEPYATVSGPYGEVARITEATLTTPNRIDAYAQQVRAAIASGEKVDGSGPIGDTDALNRDLDVTFAEHFAYQQHQASAHASGVITSDEARTIYRALGEVYSPDNGGWSAGTDLALKVTITNLMAQLIGRGV